MFTYRSNPKTCIAAVPFAVILLFVFCTTARGGILKSGGEETKGAFKNEKAVVRGDSVLISFKLDAPADETYRISITLKKRGDPSFGRTLRFVRGDVGEGEFGQKSCRVIWLFKRELSEAELGEEYGFELTCVLVEHGIPWWVYAGGGAAAVTAGVVLLGKKGNGGTQGTTSLPGPPDYRPVNP
jgi:hypothetical protein